MHNKRYILGLHHTRNLGIRTIHKILAKFPLDVLKSANMQDLVNIGFDQKLATSLSTVNFREADADLLWEQSSSSHHIITIEDTHYPSLLKEIYASPVIIYAIGDISILNKNLFAIVGTRKPSEQAKFTANNFARDLSTADLCIVSGLALGIDTIAHEATLANNAKTIAVLGTGVSHIYPKRNLALAARIAKHGLILSEFHRNTPPIPENFPQRNRIISGLSLGVLVVEAALKSGSLITARFALEQNREVFTIPGSIYNTNAAGCNKLLQDGANLATSSQDIVDALGFKLIIPKQNNRTKEDGILKFISYDTATSLDKLVEQTGLGFDKLLAMLTDLELKDLVINVGGGYIKQP
jgi:DNA processing protein